MLRRLARGALGLRPALSLMRRFKLADDPVTVLCYHSLGADRGGPDAWTVLRKSDFRAHLQRVAEDYDIISLDAAMAEGPGRSQAGRPRAVLTFDDGEAGLHRHLLPMLDALGVPVTIYIATGQIETGQPYWFDRLMGALGEGAHKVDVKGLGSWRIPEASGRARWTVLGGLLEAMKRVGPDLREEITDAILARNPLPLGRPPLGPMTRDELVALASSPWVTIGAHSHCHHLLDQIALDKAQESMSRSATLLRQWTGQAVEHFAWPNGNHTADLRAAARALGFASAAALDEALWRRESDRFALPRVGVGRHDDAARLRLRMLGF